MKEKETAKAFYNTTIPSDWEVKKLGTLVEILSGVSPSLFKLDIVGKYPYLKVEDLNNCQKYQTESREYSNDEKNLVPINSVIFPKRGAAILNNKVRINSVAVQMDSNLMAIYPKSENLSYEYLFYQITFEQLHKIADTSTIPQINNKHIIPYSFLLPPLSEQKAITHILSLMDNAINKNNLLIAKKELHKKWLMQNLLTGKKRLKGFEIKWIEYRVSQLFQTIDRYVKWNDDEKYNLVSIRRRNGGMFFREALFGNKIEVKKLKEIKRDDFLISKRQVSHGAWAIVTKEFENGKVSDEYDCLAFQGNEKVSSIFWKWYCQLPVLTHYAYVDSNGVHIEKSIFDYAQFKRRIVKIPSSLPEQIAIAQLLQAADKEIQLLKTKSEKLREQKKGMMQVLLTGKKRLKTSSK
jgi:type I restriction enzyme S subunit